jgi:hypothetical protein
VSAMRWNGNRKLFHVFLHYVEVYIIVSRWWEIYAIAFEKRSVNEVDL